MLTFECERCHKLKREKVVAKAPRPYLDFLLDYMGAQANHKPRLLDPMLAAVSALARENTDSANDALRVIAFNLGWKP